MKKVLAVTLATLLLVLAIPVGLAFAALSPAAPVTPAASAQSTNADQVAAAIVASAKASGYTPHAPVHTSLIKASVPVTSFRGTSRFDTAVMASQAAFAPGSTPFVVVVNYNNFADALSAGPLASYLGAPILLTTPGTLNAATAAEIKRLGSIHTIIVGGTTSITPSVEKSLAGITKDVSRVSAADRYTLSARIAVVLAEVEKGLSGSYTKKMFLAKGTDFADALSASPIASRLGAPILLTASASLSPTVNTYVAKYKPSIAYITGGLGSVSAAAASTLTGLGPSCMRIGGADRYEVSANLVKAFITTNCETLGFASGEVFADGLTAAPSLAARAGVLLLVKRASVPSSVAAQALRLKPVLINANVFGGTATISTATATAIKNLLK